MKKIYSVHLWGKAIKRKLYLKILNNFTEFDKSHNWNLYEDNAMDFLILKNAENFVYINKKGYLDGNKDNFNNNQEDSNNIINDLFIFAGLFFDYTDDNMLEKSLAVYQIRRIFYEYKDDLLKISSGFENYYKILDKFSNCKSISSNQLYYIHEIRNILKQVEKK